MNLYQFILPITDNSGMATVARRSRWETFVRDVAGGLTTVGQVQGWYKDKQEFSAMYQVACTYDQYLDIMDVTRAIFDDQETFLVTEMGTAQLVPGRGAQE